MSKMQSNVFFLVGKYVYILLLKHNIMKYIHRIIKNKKVYENLQYEKSFIDRFKMIKSCEGQLIR